MDEKSYSKPVISRFMQSNMFFNDPLLKKYYEQNDVKKFRSRVHKKFSDKQFTKMVYVLITDSIRDIILDTVGELTVFMESMGDLIISGGEAFNMYMNYKDRIVTTDIDAKFVPRLNRNARFFGKLQAIKLTLWDKLGKIAKRLNVRIKQRLLSKKNKIFAFLGIGFKRKGPYVTRRYTLIKKKKGSNNAKPSKEDIFIDVELFALDLNMRYFCPSSGKIEDFTLGGILDIPFMRPREFGYEVVKDMSRPSISYRNMNTGNMKVNNKVMVASKEFLIEDIYLMQKLNLRPEKKDKDRQRLFRLAKMFVKNVKSTDTMETVFKKVFPKIVKRPKKQVVTRRPRLNKALRVDPYKYEKFTSIPSKERLSKQIVHGVKTVVPNVTVKGFEKSHGNQRLNLDSYLWKKNTTNAYVKNEFNMRPTDHMNLPKNLNVQETLYGFKPRRDGWVPKPLLRRAAQIPFVGLKN